MKRIFSAFLEFFTAVFASASAYAADSAMSVYDSTVIKEGSMRMIAHSGYSAVAPENTLPGIYRRGGKRFLGR